jgi:hypothetical protein
MGLDLDLEATQLPAHPQKINYEGRNIVHLHMCHTAKIFTLIRQKDSLTNIN